MRGNGSSAKGFRPEQGGFQEEDDAAMCRPSRAVAAYPADARSARGHSACQLGAAALAFGDHPQSARPIITESMVFSASTSAPER